jgi:hypothetical protein
MSGPATAADCAVFRGGLPRHTVSRELFFIPKHIIRTLRTLLEGVRQCVTESNPPPPVLLARRESE